MVFFNYFLLSLFGVQYMMMTVCDKFVISALVLMIEG